jgi:nucleoside-diphosphate-sugar epimerase
LKVAILGSDGFVGKNLLEDLSKKFEAFGSSRRIENLTNNKIFFFDLKKRDTWNSLIEIKPDCIINCIVSGAIKNGEDVKEAIDFNYLLTQKFYEYLNEGLPNTFLIHFGTAFEYNLEASSLTEETECLPKTYYGISKYLISKFLLEGNGINNFTIIRPFNLFGPYDQESKILPYLINSQIQKVPAILSGGDQRRDYLFVKDLSNLIIELIRNKENRKNKVINAGSGKIYSIKEIANVLACKLPEFDSSLWQWGKLPYREGESSSFYNGSNLAEQCGIKITDIDLALQTTIEYYFSTNKYSNSSIK